MQTDNEPRCIVILWNGKEMGPGFASTVKQAMQEKGTVVELVDYYEMDGEALAKAAYLRALIAENSVKLPDDIDPILTSIGVIGARYAGVLASGTNAFAIKLTGDIIAELHKQSTGIARDITLISAIEILATKTITAKYATALKQHNMNRTCLEAIKNIYSLYYGNQADFL